jgi:alpha-glucosidase
MPNWLNDAVFYEIYPQSFYDSNNDGIGDLNGITEKLGYVEELGCNAIWINPCFDSPFMDAGYDVRDYKKVAPRYGTNDDLIALFNAAHQKGIKVLLDLVPGHTSDEHEWFKQSCRAEKNAFTNRFVWNSSVWDNPKDYHFISGRAERDANFMVNFFSMQPALNYGFNRITEDWQLPYTHPDCIATREAMKDVMRFWLDKGCDGFRVDMARSLVKNDDDEKTATCALWNNVRAMLDSEYPEAALISEWCCPELTLKNGFHCDFYLNRKGNGYYNLFRDHDSETGKSNSFFSANGKGDIMRFLDEYLPMYNQSKQNGFISLITCNHDTERLGGTLTETELKLAYAMIFTLPGVPFLYYGDEIGMKYQKNLVSKEGGYFRTGTRTPMQWTGGENAGFSRAPAEKLYLPVDGSANAPSVEAQQQREDSLLETVKSIIKLRHAHEDLRSGGPFEVLFAESGTSPFVYKRGGYVIAVNPSKDSAAAPVSISGDVVYAIGATAQIGGGSIKLAPQSFTVIKQELYY